MNDYKYFDDLNIELIDGDRGKNYPRNDEMFKNGYCLFLNAKNVTINGFVFDENVFITKEKDEMLRKGKLSRNDIVLTTRGTIGNVGLYDDKIPYDNVRINSGMLIIRNNDKNVNTKYLYYQLTSPFIRNQIFSLKTGSAQPQIPITVLKKLKLLIPDIEIQDKIVKVMDSITDKLSLNNKINNNLYELAINYLKDKSATNEVLVSKFARIQGGYAFKGKNLINTYTKNRIIKIKNLRSEINADVINSQFVEDEVVEKLDNKFRLSKGDVAIAMTGAELGKTGFIYGDDNYYLNQRVGVVRGNNKASELYLNVLFLSEEFQKLLNSKGYGSAQPNVSTSDIENILVNDITEDNLNEFYKIVKPIYENIISNSEEILSLEQLRDTLLPKLMNGEIDLDNIKI
jgi:type I restriction enzyme S subunit